MDLSNNKKSDLFIETPELQISKYVITFRDTAIQISNISSVAICSFPKKSIPTITWIFIVLGLLAFTVNPFIGILLVGFGGVIIFKIYQDNQDPGKYIKIAMNSGIDYFFTSGSTIFLKEVAETIAYCINHPNEHRDNVTINITDSKIENSPITAGNNKSDIHL